MLSCQGATPSDCKKFPTWLASYYIYYLSYHHVIGSILSNLKVQANNVLLYYKAISFRFWQYGEWVDVVVDDYLPTRFNKLMFMNSKSPNEFWTALTEKAYAKLHGSYEALKGGTTCEAMVDFTGGCSEMYQLKESDCPGDIMTIMLKAFDRCSMKGCSMEPDPNVTEAKTDVGLIRGHAYSITKVVRAKIETPRASGK